MMQWRVRDVMTTDVTTMRDNASVSEIAEMLTQRQISAIPVVDEFGTVIGVVSWTDLHNKIEIDGPGDYQPRAWLHRRPPPHPRWPNATALDVMSAPAVTVGPDASLSAAGRAMHRRNVGRLLVVDDQDRLVGIVTRTDLLNVHARLDSVIRDEIVQSILRRTLMIDTGTVKVTVHDGVVTLTGGIQRKTTALAATGLTEAVPGVTAVVDQLTFDIDDTLPSTDPSSAGRHPHHD